ncbi:hypothetical protein RJ641_005772 [Dillenia turbinata]|uniref:DUF7804 domain-containing protein n=1 Tax=Dillenia turbinata TaxID=194707 RepID=A0AAN8Z9E2_9MAGN
MRIGALGKHHSSLTSTSGQSDDRFQIHPINKIAIDVGGRGHYSRSAALNLKACWASSRFGLVKGEEEKSLGKKGSRSSVPSERLDEWMRKSVVDIVKNLRRAPLLVQVYPDSKMKTERALEGDWPFLMKEWEEDESKSPEGVIFVEELRDTKAIEGGGGAAAAEGSAGQIGGGMGDCTKMWGVLIQGKGVECKPTCYLLKTSSVRSDVDLRCTHFCLMKVKSFRESALSQLTNCWLQ